MEPTIGSKSSVDTSLDNVVVQKMIEDIPGGVSLDVSGVTSDVIPAGTVVIKNTSTGDHKPNPQSTPGTYDALPGGHEYVGVTIASVLKSKPFVGLMVRGTINEKAAVNNEQPAYLTAMKTAFSLIRFV